MVSDNLYALNCLTFPSVLSILESEYEHAVQIEQAMRIRALRVTPRTVQTMMSRICLLLACLRSMFRSYASVRLENLALRHQVAVYKQSMPRPKLKPADRMFWVWLSRLWPDWQWALEFVQPRTVIAWQNKRF
jgi:hypothetical protein